MLKNVFLSYFSPTGATKRTAQILTKALSVSSSELDLSVLDFANMEFATDDIVVFAAPVFGGRVPGALLDNIRKLHAQGSKAILMAVYGNRAFDDALLELSDAVIAQGFTVVAALGLVAEHSMLRTVAAGRPDEQDVVQIEAFARQILDKLAAKNCAACTDIPGNRPYKEWQPMKLQFVLQDSCNKCGLCISKCPMQAIPSNEPKALLPDRCTVCLRCIAICPQQARSLPQPVQAALAERLGPLVNMRRDNQIFL